MPPERKASGSYEKPQAVTEGVEGPVIAQWRSNGGLPPLPLALPSAPLLSANGPLHLITPRLTSGMGANRYAASDTSFESAIPKSSAAAESIQLCAPAQRLRESERAQLVDGGRNRLYRKRAAMPMLNVSSLQEPPPITRSRNASQPTARTESARHGPFPKNVPIGTGKRGSGSSQSTGVGIHTSRSHGAFDAVQEPAGAPPVKVKVHFHDIFVIQAPRTTEYDDLVEKVGRKIRLRGPRRDDRPLPLKYPA
ncbi:hypothetical protein HYPSUDRAFT_209116 [Hypholoma sublateritium FD-334 SS-4]|uniref:Uncharacterized protein n=1 Tax=Hypholoma sublateritium (strain FD-334 SS-4) TaxID=945553 RepID=A0A0D2NZU2_HYPSF|nr:hypothetical protein HYPSUDRAFT_209116 [Hypholoma sublateritium FD-334 SS-4]